MLEPGTEEKSGQTKDYSEGFRREITSLCTKGLSRNNSQNQEDKLLNLRISWIALNVSKIGCKIEDNHKEVFV